MFDELITKLLEGYNVYPQAKAPMQSGPNAISPGPLPAGFLGGGLPGINPSAQTLLMVKKKKKKKPITKKKNRL